jgi:peptidylprolyl isomerase
MPRRGLLTTVLALAIATAACSGGADDLEIPDDALRTPSGIASKVLRVGLGTVRPTPRSTVTVHYTGWTMDGKQFESSLDRGKPATFRLDEVIPGWTEALQLMVRTEKRRFWIPGHLAYDNSPDPTAPKGMLVFDIELLEVR